MLFYLGLVILIAGYFTYGRYVTGLVELNENADVPCDTHHDGVDFQPLATWKVFFIHLLNIAGLGPIFGAIMGALYGPVALLYIVIGCIFAGAVHDFLAGVISIRSEGKNFPALVGDALGKGALHFTRLFTLVAMILVGIVFVVSPAKLIVLLSGKTLSLSTVTAAIFIYYFVATIMPIDKIIGRIYPFFGFLLIFMTLGIGGGMIAGGYTMPRLSDLNFASVHPGGIPVWPAMFITIACGAISGFHATQAPMMARCLKKEPSARKVFYGAMVVEGIIGLIWATAALTLYEEPGALMAAVKAGTPAQVVMDCAMTLMGSFGYIAIAGVIILPITSGDTSFRCARLILADSLKLDQKPIKNRLILAVPMFAFSIWVVLGKIDYQILWQYFGWANEVIATLALWTGAVYLKRNNYNYWPALVPACFITTVVTTFILSQKVGFQLPLVVSSVTGIIFSLATAVLLIRMKDTQTS